MLKKSIMTLMMVMILSLSAIVGVEAAASSIDKSKLSSGIININYKSPKNLKTAVSISKGGQKSDHILGANNNFPLQFGEGEYTITVLESAGGNKFRQIEKEVVNFKATNKTDLYLGSIQMINWNENMNSIKKAKELTKDAKTDKEKLIAIHGYIVNNVKYDHEKAKLVQAGYVSSLEETLRTGQAICYDYSALMAGMLRSVGLPTKLVTGRNAEITEYHAWNQVYLKETNEWVLVDATYDAGYKAGNADTPMIKNQADYTVEKEY